MSTCPTCSEEGPAGALFCGSCGSRLVSGQERASDPLVGKTLKGTYFIQEKIGSGGMGDVYKAIHTKLECPVAIKIVKRELLGHSAMAHRFEREARAASRLRHPNVVAVTDFGQSEDGTLFMVMEHVTGRSLARVIADDAPMAERRVVRIGSQILSAMALAHAHEILHRDLKPENVMVEARRDEPDSVKVLDFGIVKLLTEGAGSSTLTQAGLVCGTPGYMSPEQLRGGDVDARSDLFSVGVVLYEMLTRKLPFDVQTPMEVLHKHLSEPIPPPSDRRGQPVSPALEGLVMQALSPSRDERPPSADAMREQLLACVTGAETRDVEATEPRVPTKVLPRSDARRAGPPSRRTTPPRMDREPAGTPAPGAVTPARGDPAFGGKTPQPHRTRAGAGATRALTAGTSFAAARASGIDAGLLKQLEDRIAPLLGPVAPYLVSKMSRSAADVADLCQQLAAFIPSRDERERFLEWSSEALPAARAKPRTPPPAATPAVSWDPAVLDRARRNLAAYVGPLAKIIVRRVSARACDEHDLYDRLALEIPNERERAAFMRQAQSTLDREG